jgi:CHAT domain-containing protein
MSAGQFAAQDVSPALQRLSQLVYAPLAPHLTHVTHLIVCPDGQLSRLPFEMLPVGDKFLIEEKTISYVGSGREIVRLQRRSGVAPDSNSEPAAAEKVRPAGSPAYVGKSLVMGNPDFDLDLAKVRSRRREEAPLNAERGMTNAESSQSLVASATRSLSRDYRGMRFSPLPEAEAEARNVAKLLGGDTVLRLGAGAREAELKAVVSPRVLHLATHGFFLADQEFKRTNSLPDSWAGNWGARWNASLPKEDWENPLIRCGIALAGANHFSNSELGIRNSELEDGMLTGLEASLLNLQGTELVILSACDSGSGEVKIGEGLMSLRRAFRIAGAETVLASHWKVSDRATSRLMTEFMRRWRAGEPRVQAWREAQLSLIRSQGAREDFSDPFFWSAFTLTGQWR